MCQFQMLLSVIVAVPLTHKVLKRTLSCITIQTLHIAYAFLDFKSN